MKKNVAGQVIGAQMITAADGSNFTGVVTAYVTGDNGAQTIGSVGDGICAHKGQGYHSYTPSKGESNFDHAAFTLSGVGAITATPQAYTSFPQSADVAPIVNDLNDVALGKWVVDPEANTLTLYRIDGITVLKVFDLTASSDIIPAYLARVPAP